MTSPVFGRLSDVAPREAWPHEARDMTPWLADNLDRLGEVIGLPSLDLIETEVSVDTFAADILARDAMGDRLVLIENQLECSDHTHLGQIMTYLSGLDAQVMVWIAPRFRDAHLSAIRWLNENTLDPFAFFAVRLRVVRIERSPLAPLLELVEEPDGWERHVQAEVRKRGGLSGDAQMRRDFWAFVGERHPDLAIAKPYAASSRWLPTEDERVWLSLFFSKTGVGLFVRGPREDEAAPRAILTEHSRELSQELGVDLESDQRFLLQEKRSIDMTVRENWTSAVDWLASRAEDYRRALDDVSTRSNP